METALKTSKLCKTFSTGGLQQHVLKNLDIEIYKGDFTVIMGSSGSGKSTLLYALSGMDRPTLGDVYFMGAEISALSGDRLAEFRRKHCGFVFQQIHLLDNMSVLDNVLAAGLLTGGRRADIAARAKKLLLGVGLEETEWGKLPNQLSGGEAQRAGIVRAIINEPDILFADEPTGALNSAAGKSVLDIMSGINDGGQSVVTVTHDIKTAARGSRILYLKDGSICGDIRLDGFGRQDAGRMETLQRFLEEMGW